MWSSAIDGFVSSVSSTSICVGSGSCFSILSSLSSAYLRIESLTSTFRPLTSSRIASPPSGGSPQGNPRGSGGPRPRLSAPRVRASPPPLCVRRLAGAPTPRRRRWRRSCRRRRRGRRGPATRAPRRRRRARSAAAPAARALADARPSANAGRAARPAAPRRARARVASASAGRWPRRSARSAVGRDEREHGRGRPRQRLGDERGRLAGKSPLPVLLPRLHEPPRRLVVDDRGPRGRERDPPAAALGAAPHRPGAGRAAAIAERRRQPDQRVATARAEPGPGHAACGTPVRQQDVEEHCLDRTGSRVTGVSRIRDDCARSRARTRPARAAPAPGGACCPRRAAAPCRRCRARSRRTSSRRPARASGATR